MSEGRFSSEELLPQVYEQLRSLARAKMRAEHAGHTLQATMLVHEAYLRVAEDGSWSGEGHFFGAAALAMRRILVEQARRRNRLKRGGGRVERQPLEDVELAAIEPPAGDVLAVDDAVKKLEAKDPRKGQIVNLRYFAGLTNEETAAALGVSVGTVEREWRFIRSWLQSELGEPAG